MDERVADTAETEEAPTKERPDNLSKGSKDFTPEERAGIIAKAKEVGFEKVADEFGIKARLISYWIQQEKKKVAKQSKAAKPLKPLKQAKSLKQTTAKSKDKDSKRTLEHIAENVQTMPTEPVKTVEPLITDEPVKPTGRKMETAKKNEEKQTQRDGQALIIENAILKERIALLNGEIEKLRAALTNLM